MVPSAPKARYFIQRRRSTNHVQTANTMLHMPVNQAIMRWLCSYTMPPIQGGSFTRWPYEVGQSGTDRPASSLVTSAPAIMTRKVTAAMKSAMRWCHELYGVAMDSKESSFATRNFSSYRLGDLKTSRGIAQVSVLTNFARLSLVKRFERKARKERRIPAAAPDAVRITGLISRR